jgi:hypothetical protein
MHDKVIKDDKFGLLPLRMAIMTVGAGRCLIYLVMLLVTTPSWAYKEGRLLGQSTSGQTVVFNLGHLDGLVEGDYAVIVKEIRSLDFKDLRLVPVAKARNIKVNSTHSIWILYKIFDPELLVKADPYLVLMESQMLLGRRDPRFGRISVVTDKNKTSLQIKQTLSEDKDRLSKLKTQYPEIETLHEKDLRSDADGELIDVESWKKVNNDRYRTALYKGPHQEDFRRQLKLATFEKLVTAYLKKVNDPDFNYETFYIDQMRDSFSNEFRQKTNFQTEYESFLSRQAQKAVEDAKLFRSLLEKGEAWSEDFSDDELRAILNQVSVLQERDRKILVMTEPKRFTLYFAAGLNLTDAQTNKDSYRRRNSYSTEVDFEGIPLIKHERLERFTLNASFRINKTALETAQYNSNMDELSFATGLNWYPVYSPYAVEAPAIFMGIYLRSGTATLNSPTLNQNAHYTVYSLPGVRAGLKFNFKNNVGLRMALSMEKLKLDQYKKSDLNSILPDQVNLVEGKMSLALAYLF